jgi:hypothetical protein
MQLLTIASLLAVFTAANAQSFNLNCNFVFVRGTYVCQLNGVTVPDNQNLNFIIGGTHVAGYDDSDVREIAIQNSNIPFVVTPLFLRFRNVRSYYSTNSGVTRIQSGAFRNATNLSHILVNREFALRTLEPNGFSDALNLVEIDLGGGIIEEIHPTAFANLNRLTSLDLRQNKIQRLSAQTLATLPSLRTFAVSRNELESIDDRLFANNPQITTLDFDFNQINAIGRNLLDNFDNLQFLGLSNNLCISARFDFVRFPEARDTVRGDLEACFGNFDSIQA